MYGYMDNLAYDAEDVLGLGAKAKPKKKAKKKARALTSPMEILAPSAMMPVAGPMPLPVTQMPKGKKIKKPKAIVEPGKPTVPQPADSGISTNTLLMIGGAGLLLYILMGRRGR